MFRRLAAVLTILAASIGLSVVSTSAQDGPAADPQLPMIFVHGFMGSGQQFESQALRFTSNGYPADLIDTFEHDSLAYPGSQSQVWTGIDAKIDALLASSGAEQVYLLGHSQGTGVVQSYLNSTPERASRVAAYVNLDGGSAESLPGGVRTLAIWGEGSATREVTGATNVRFADQAHTEVVNSPETFAAIYEFLLGDAPEVTEVIRESGTVAVSGRAVMFPANTGAAGSKMVVYEVAPTTGERVGDAVSSIDLVGDGAFGPLDLKVDTNYEFEFDHGSGGLHHVYPQPFVRSTRWFRLLTSPPDGLANGFWEPSKTSQNLSVLRNEEWWADQGAGSDALAINGTNVLSTENSPRSNRTIGIFLHDADTDGTSNSVADPDPSGLPFLTGIDVVIPAGDPSIGTTSVRSTPRNGDGDETLCIPALSSENHRMSVQFNSYHRLLDASGAPAAGPADPTCAPAPAAPIMDASDPILPGRPSTPATPIKARPGYTG